MCSAAMETNPILGLSWDDCLDLLKPATFALHPLIHCFHFGYQHVRLPETTVAVSAIYSPQRSRGAKFRVRPKQMLFSFGDMEGTFL